MFSVFSLLCKCDPCGPGSLMNGTCVAGELSKCYTAKKLLYEEGQWIEEWDYGCLPPDEQTIMQVREGFD